MIGLIGERSGDWNQLSADPNPTWVVPSSQQSRALCAETGTQETGCWVSLEVALSPLFFYLPGFPSGRQNVPCPDLADNFNVCIWHSFLFPLLFLVFHHFPPRPTELRQFAAAHLSGISEHPVTKIPVPFFPLLHPCSLVFTL